MLPTALSTNKKCLVLDTNIWVYDTYLLRSPMGASILYYIKLGDIIIGLPEVVELEILKHSLKLAKQSIETIQENFKKIEILFGERDDYIVPSEEQISQFIKRRLDFLEPHLFRIPFSLNQARGALNKVLDEIPPNAPKNQQYKDSLIWETILELSKDYIVYFLTQDKGFYENREPKRGLAKELRNEIESLGGVVNIYPTTESFLNDIKQDVLGIDRDILEIKLKEYVLNYIKSNQGISDLIIKDVKELIPSLFLTERPNIISVSFKFDLIAANKIYEKITVTIQGECSYNIDEGTIYNLSLDSVSQLNSDGSKNVILYAGGQVNIGRGIKKYNFRSPIG